MDWDVLTGTLYSAAIERIARIARCRSLWTSPVEEMKTRNESNPWLFNMGGAPTRMITEDGKWLASGESFVRNCINVTKQ